jgi:hypothetical protein
MMNARFEPVQEDISGRLLSCFDSFLVGAEVSSALAKFDANSPAELDALLSQLFLPMFEQMNPADKAAYEAVIEYALTAPEAGVRSEFDRVTLPFRTRLQDPARFLVALRNAITSYQLRR